MGVNKNNDDKQTATNSNYYYEMYFRITSSKLCLSKWDLKKNYADAILRRMQRKFVGDALKSVAVYGNNISNELIITDITDVIYVMNVCMYVSIYL